VPIPSTSLPSKSSRLALAATGAAASVAVLVSGGVAAADGGRGPAFRVAADSAQPASGQRSSRPGRPAAGHPAAAGRTRAAGRKLAASRKPAGHRASPSSLQLLFGSDLAGATSSGHGRRSSRPAASAHRGHAGPAPSRRVRACGDSTLHWWICHAERVLEQHGTAHGLLSTGAAYIVVRHESGGNPHAYNGWDSNAAAGHPSEGIAQVIGPTFHAYGLRGYRDIWNPVDNMIAAFRYAISRYGSMNNIPGVVAVRHGGSYVGY
jgi:Transglycosylase SLT domain